MHKFRKVLTGVAICAGVSCLGGAVAACTTTPEVEPNYLSLSFEGAGLDYVLQGALAQPDAEGNIFQSGKVKEGLTVSFKILVGENTQGTPKIVTGDGTEIVPDADGVYSFVMTADTVVKAEGLSNLCTLTLHKGQKVGTQNGQDVYEERRISYIGEDGKELGETVRLVEGSSIKFKLKISPYYKEFLDKEETQKAYTVVYGTEELMEDEKGFYTLSDVKGDERGELHVSVNKLEQDDPFQVRADCGTGTESDPYLISRPIDLFNLAALVNLGMYTSLNMAYYRLEEDIDMEGEQLYVIGDYSNENAVFMGHFDGNGHTIKNFYITDEVIDQESFEKAHLIYTGLFGCAVATTSAPVEIKNLTLEDYTITVTPAASELPAYVGSLVGNSIGLRVTNCHVNGTIEVNGNNNYMIYAGGIAGLMQAAFSNDVSYDTFVQSSSADIDINGLGSPRSAGGIVGYLASADENAIAYVVNSYSRGSVVGAMHDGGIVGTMGRYSSVANCYSEADVYAKNQISGSSTNAVYKVAYAGGIAGYAEEDTVISNCYSANVAVDANSSTQGSSKSGYIVGEWSKNRNQFLSSASSELCLYGNKARDNGDAVAGLGWSDKDWIFANGRMPEIKYSAEAREFRVTIKNGSTEVVNPKTIAGVRAPIYQWYVPENEVGFHEYYSEGGERSWGYYFDEGLTQKVPYGFVPANDNVTLYFGMADYSEVAGRYYIKSGGYGNVAYFDLGADGRMYFRQGGMNYECTYSYDGTQIIAYDSCLAALAFGMEEIDNSYFTVVGTKTADGFSLYGIAYLIDLENTTQDEEGNLQIAHKLDSMSFEAVKQSNSFKYGSYTTSDGTENFTFLENMTGLYTGEDEVVAYTYSFTDNGQGLSLSNGWTAAVSDGLITAVKNVAVTRKDAFGGVWKKNANSGVSYSFDGVSALTYTAGKAAPVTVDYEVDANTGRAVFTLNGKSCEAFIDSQTGFLNIDGETYYRGDGFTGGWYMAATNERIEVTLEGMGAGDYGYATIHYAGDKVGNMEAQYDVMQYTNGTVLRLYVRDVLYGELLLTDDAETVSGAFYSLNSDEYTQAEFYLYDNFKGAWASNLQGIDTVSFNGKGANGKADATLKMGAETVRGSYELTDASTGTVTAGGKTYTVTLDEFTNKITMTETVEEGSAGASGQLARRDGWYGVVLYDNDGNSYAFDGKGYIGGTVTVSNGTTLEYTITADGSVEVEGTALKSNGGLSYNGAALFFKTGFDGDWLISGRNEIMTVGEVDGDFIAKVTYGGQIYDFVYNPAADTLVLTQGSLSARIISTLSHVGNSGTEIAISRTGGEEEKYLNCIKEANADEYRGEYVNADSGERVSFDGLGASIGGGKAAYTSASGERFEYTYTVDEFGLPHIVDGAGRRELQLRPSTATDAGFIKDGNKYELIELNALYGVAATGNLGDGPVRFIFDGISTLYSGDAESGHEKKYTYSVISSYEAELTDEDGVKYLATVTTEGRINTLKIETYAARFTGFEVYVKENESDAEFIFKADGKLYRVVKDGDDVAEYDYEIVSAYSVILTKGEKKYRGTIKVLSNGTLLTLEEMTESA